VTHLFGVNPQKSGATTQNLGRQQPEPDRTTANARIQSKATRKAR
jgi:hypothetical protein